MEAPERSALEELGHLKQKVCLMWGSPELDIFISRLIMDSRDGQRKGLPMEVGAELLFLAKTNKMIRAIDIARTQQVAFRDAMQLVEEGDQKRLEADNFDNPLVSRDMVVRERGPDRRAVPDRRTAPRESASDRRSGQERRHGTNSLTMGDRIFRLVFSKATLFLIVFALTAKLLWPYFSKVAG
jgi:hypothetical protein